MDQQQFDAYINELSTPAPTADQSQAPIVPSQSEVQVQVPQGQPQSPPQVEEHSAPAQVPSAQGQALGQQQAQLQPESNQPVSPPSANAAVGQSQVPISPQAALGAQAVFGQRALGGQSAEAEDIFVPRPVNSLKEAGLSSNDLYPIILRYLFLHGSQMGNMCARQLRLPYVVVEPVLSSLKKDLLIAYKGSSMGGDYHYELTPKGVEQARLALSSNTYCGSAPVPFSDYRDSCFRQSIKHVKSKYEDVLAAMDGLLISKLLIGQLGQAINSGSSMFLFGPPGNGKQASQNVRFARCSPSSGFLEHFASVEK